MEKTKTALGALFFCVTGFYGAQAQSSLYFKDQSGTTLNTIPLSTIKNITFNATYVNVNKVDGNVNLYTYSSFRNISFAENTTDIDAGKLYDSNSISVYPNPVKDQLVLRLKQPGVSGQLTIASMQGDIVFQEGFEVDQMTAAFNVDYLAQGFYICHVQTGNESKIIKFIKE
jgi:hypothetical protein